MTVLSLISKKGGVGKTTTSVNLAAGLARRGYKVLLVDLDSQASASISVGLSRNELSPSAADCLFRSMPIREARRPTTTPRLDVVPASIDLLAADADLAAHRDREDRLRRRLDPVREDYDYILIDCPPSLSLLPLNALRASDGYLIPAPPQYLAVEGVANLAAGIERLAQRWPTRPKLVGLLVTMADYRLKATKRLVAALRDRFGAAALRTEIRINVRLAEAPERGQNIYDYDPYSTGAAAYERLVDEVLERLPPSPGKSPHQGNLL